MFPMGGWGADVSGDASPSLPPEKKDRNTELENILGNLLVAKYQVQRLEEKLAYVARSAQDSTFIFKNDNKWYKISVNVTEQQDKKEEEELNKAFETSP